MAERCTGKFKFQAAMDVLTGEKSAGQVARVYGVHPQHGQYLERTLPGKRS
jgi:transposase-like protein